MPKDLSNTKPFKIINAIFGTVGFFVVLGALVLTVYSLNNQSFDPRSSAKSESTDLNTKPDLDVLFIRREPRQNRYLVNYTSIGPISSQYGEWPEDGTQMSYTAVVKNTGGAETGEFTYAWTINGKHLTETNNISPTIEPGESETFTLQLPWTGEADLIRFDVSPTYRYPETSTDNNSRTIKADGLSFRLHIEQSVYDEFNSLKNALGTYSFEDWAQNHFTKTNEIISQGYQNLPGGVGNNLEPEYVFLDDVEVVSDGTLPNCCEHAPEDIEWDGRWGFERDEWNSAKVNQWIGRIENALIHEWTHQLGIIDEYRFNYDWNYAANNQVNGEIYYIPWQALMNDINSLSYSQHTINGLRTNKGYRRGYFGEYLYDIPTNNSIRVINNDKAQVCGAVVKLYQKSPLPERPWEDQIDNIPEITGSTNKTGLMALPNRPVTPIDTSTDHHLRANPFGQISVVGNNSLFLVEVTYKGQNYYDWLSIYKFNYEYWAGRTDNATYEVLVDIPTSLLTTCR